MKHVTFLVALLTILVLGIATIPNESAIPRESSSKLVAPTQVADHKKTNPPTLVIRVKPGPTYTQKAKMGIMSLTVIPQMAFWIETEDGRFIDTIYVTKKAATGKWSSAGGSRRPESLPVWSHARGVKVADGGFMPDPQHPLPDAVSGATPTQAFEKSTVLPDSLIPGTYIIKAEINSSFDWNEAYPDKLPKTHPRWSEVNGQPSVLYEGRLEVGKTPASVVLEPIGTGSLRGEDGNVTLSLDGLTTALQLVASIEAEYRP